MTAQLYVRLVHVQSSTETAMLQQCQAAINTISEEVLIMFRALTEYSKTLIVQGNWG